MVILKEFIVAILTGYLAFTNFLAVQIESLFVGAPEAERPMIVTEGERAADPNELTSLPSRLGRAIPDLLLRNDAYQQAAVVTSGDQIGATTANPIEAIVNIFCTLTTDDYIRTTTGTGFFVDPDGVILTNAHIAQFLLMAKTSSFGNAECVVRTDNPATPRYLADLLYISPAWIQENASVFNDDVPMGTGERDYALLYVSNSYSGEPLPARFPALAFSTDNLPLSIRNTSVTAAGYPATNLLERGPSADLIPQSAYTSISELYTFGSNYADVFSIRGSVVGAEGASGGPVVNAQREVIGVIVTRGDDNTDGPGSLRAITLSHIDRTIREETGLSFSENLRGNLPYRSQIFGETLAPFLITLLKFGQEE